MNVRNGLISLMALAMMAGAPQISRAGETQLFGGLRVPFSAFVGKSAPELGVGVRHLSGDNDCMYGAGAEVFVPVYGADFMKPNVEAYGLGGNEDVLGKIGAGYDFASGVVTLPVGVMNGHLVLGTDALNPFESAFVGANSAGVGFDENGYVVEQPIKPINGDDSL